MAKTSVKASKKQDILQKGVKDGRVKKSSIKSKEAAKKAAAKVEPSKIPKKKKKKAAESSSDEDSSDSDESVDEKPVLSKKAAAKDESSDASSSDSDSASDTDSASSDSDSETKPTPKAKGKDKLNGTVKTNGATKLNGTAKANHISNKEESDSDSASSDDSDSDSSASSASEAEPTKTDKAVKTAADDSNESASDSDDSGSDSSSGSDEETEVKEAIEDVKPATNKRKAQEEPDTTAKKPKNAATNQGSEASKVLFVGHLSWNVDNEWLRREFESFGTLVRADVAIERDSGRSRGFGFVEYETVEEAQEAHKQMTGYELDGRTINVDFSGPPKSRDAGDNRQRFNDRAKKYDDKIGAPSETLFIGNLPFDADNDGLKEFFSSYGNITRVSIPTDRETGNPKGFGYVAFETVEEAKAALEGNTGASYGGRTMRLDYSTPRDNAGGSGGRGGFGGRGGGRGGGFGGGRGRGAPRGGGRGGRGGRPQTEFKGTKVSFD